LCGKNRSEPIYSSISNQTLTHANNGSFIIHLLLSLCFLLLFLYPSLQHRNLSLASNMNEIRFRYLVRLLADNINHKRHRKIHQIGPPTQLQHNIWLHEIRASDPLTLTLEDGRKYVNNMAPKASLFPVSTKYRNKFSVTLESSESLAVSIASLYNLSSSNKSMEC